MAQARRGRPPTPLNPNASHAAKLGAVLREHRTNVGLTQEQLADRAGCSAQHISEVERAKTTPSLAIVAAVDRALEAEGALERLLPPVLQDREDRRQERAEARRAAAPSSLPCDATHSEVAGEDVQPTNRRDLIGAGATAALGLSVITSAPTAASGIDPDLPAHWASLLRLLGRHDQMFGPRGVLGVVRREAEIIAAHREVARGELRTQLLRVEARWAACAAWLSEDTGDLTGAIAWTERSLQLAREASDPDMIAFARARQSRSAGQRDARRAVEFAEAGMLMRGASSQTRAWCTRLAALGYAHIKDAGGCERRIADAYTFLEDSESPAPPWASGYRVTAVGTLADEAYCWSHLQPRKAIPLYERALRDWPRSEARDGGLHRARLAIVCAATGERDRAEAEGRKALAIARATHSSAIDRELRRLGGLLPS